MVLYFMRLTPGASGFSPFMLSHGWEPNTPLKLLYKVRVKDELGDIDLEEWLMRNSERIQQLRGDAVVNYSEVSRKRKEKWDKRAVERLYAIGNKVMYRVPGLDTKLADSWIGPFEVTKVLGLITYQVDFNGGKVRVVHVRFLKEYLDRAVKRATTILLNDTEGDSVVEGNREVVITGETQLQERQRDIDQWVTEYSDILTNEPGLMRLAEFSIDMGESKPVCQRPYSTPVTLREGVDKEIEWLLAKGYVRPSDSTWSAPIVTVRKPYGAVRLHVDFKRVNEVITPLPFYMPCVEEVLEAVGRSRVIS